MTCIAGTKITARTALQKKQRTKSATSGRARICLGFAPRLKQIGLTSDFGYAIFLIVTTEDFLGVRMTWKHV